MMKNLKKLICTGLVIAMCFSFAACKQNTAEDETTSDTTAAQTTAGNATQNSSESTSEVETTEKASTSTTAENKTTKKSPSTTKKQSSDYDTSISLNEALDVLSDFYGSDYNVNATVVEDGWQYFSVIDKKGSKYASVRVNLNTSDAVETIIATGETNEYNLLA